MAFLEVETIFTGGLSDKELAAMERAIPGIIKTGLIQVNHAMMDDAINVVPKPPIDEGNLRASGHGYVNGELVGSTATVKAAFSFEVFATGESESSGLQNKGGPNTSTVGFNTPYAPRQHEEWTHSNKLAAKYAERGADISEVGRDYLTPKIENLQPKYEKIFEETVVPIIEKKMNETTGRGA